MKIRNIIVDDLKNGSTEENENQSRLRPRIQRELRLVKDWPNIIVKKREELKK